MSVHPPVVPIQSWQPEPFKHSAMVRVSTWLTNETDVEITVDEVSLTDVQGVIEHLVAQLTEITATMKQRRRRTPRKKKEPGAVVVPV